MRFNKHLPTAEALGSYFATYGRHCRVLHLRHLDAASAQVGRADSRSNAGLQFQRMNRQLDACGCAGAADADGQR